MGVATLILAVLLGAACANARSGTLTPEQICARTPIDARVRLTDTRFVACYKQAVWEVRDCPKDLRFEQASQTCVPA